MPHGRTNGGIRFAVHWPGGFSLDGVGRIVAGGAPLPEVQLRREAKPSILFKLISNFNSFLTELREQQPQVPDSLCGLREAGVVVQIVNSDVGVGSPMVPWRVAVYI